MAEVISSARARERSGNKRGRFAEFGLARFRTRRLNEGRDDDNKRATNVGTSCGAQYTPGRWVWRKFGGWNFGVGIVDLYVVRRGRNVEFVGESCHYSVIWRKTYSGQ